MGSFSPCADILKEGKSLSSSHEIYPILFNSLDCITTLTQKKSVDYLENVAIPYLRKRGINHVALDYCDFLLNLFEKRNKLKNSLRISKLIIQISKEMMNGGGL